MKKRLFLIASAALVLAACAKEEAYQFEESPIAGRTKISIGASFELPESGATKSDIDDDGNFTWATTDAIWIGSDETVKDGETFSRLKIEPLSGEIGPGYINAKFSGTLIGYKTAVAAISPVTYDEKKTDYNAEPRFESNKLYVSLPKARVWKDAQVSSLNTGSKLTRQADNLLIARYKDIYDGGYEQGRTEGLEFKNAGGLFRLELAKLPLNATKVVFTTDKKINGEFLVEDTEENGVHYPVINTSEPSVDEEKSVSFDILVTDSNKSDRVLYIPVPVGQYKIGFKVLDGNDNDKVLWEFSTSRSNSVRRGHMVKMPPLTFVTVGGSGEGATNIIVTPEGYTGTVYLPSTENNIYVRMYGTDGPINIEYSQNGDLKPANVYLQALGDITTLNINLPESHVELTGEDKVHTLTNVKANTSIGTFVVDNKVKIGKEEVADSGLKITGGSLNLQAPTQKVTIDIPESAANTTAHKVQININSTIKALAVDRAAYTEKVADKIYVKLAPPVSETPTAITVEGINVKEKNCNLWVASNVTVDTVKTKAAENTVAGMVKQLAATGEGTVVSVTSEATVSTTISAADGATVVVEKGATVTNNKETSDGGTIITDVDSESVAIVGSNSYATLAAAVAAATDDATITIIKAGEYDALPALTKTLTFVSSVDGVIINQTTNAEIAAGEIVTFKNIAFNLSDVQYLGFGKKSDSANGELVMEGCTIEGSLSLYGKSTFTDCKFTANGKYNIWAVLTDASFSGCSFTNTNRAVNVYDFKHDGSSVKNVSFDGCTFAGTAKKKAAINIHHNPDGTAAKYAVTIKDCTTTGTWASNVEDTGEPADATVCNSALWMVSDIKNWTNGDITVNGVNVFDAPVAQIGATPYTTLEAAVAAAEDGQTITLLSDVALTESLVIAEGKNLTLDLGTHSISGAVNGKLITNNGTLTINASSSNPGKVYNTDVTAQGHDAVYNAEGATITINGGIFGDSDSDMTNGNNVNRGAGIRNLGTATLNGGKFTACDNYLNGGYAYAIINGSDRETCVLTIKDGVEVYGQNNGNIAANAGTVNINGGVFNITGAQSYYCLYSYNGIINVVGGTYTKTNGTSKHMFCVEVDDDNRSNPGKINVSGGSFTQNNTTTALASSADNISITGGTFTVDPSAYVANGYQAVENNGTWTVQKLQGVAKIGTTIYATLAEAVAAVPATGGEATTITMVADVANATGMSVAAGKNFTVDFNNHTYTLNKPGAGSAGTETIGFQLLQGSTITFKNGTINISEENLAKATIGNNIKRVIQNYANLTLDNMTIDGTNQYDKKDYVVSFNNGTSVINNTKIKGADASKVIFDVCTWATYVATSVTVSDNSVIDGNIEVSATNTPEALALTLTSGTHNGSLVMASGADKATITKSDSFSEVAPEGYSWKSNGDGTSTLIANVAKIGDSYYATLADAVAAVPTTGEATTITMVADATVEAGVTIAAEKSVILELNGKTISGNTDSNATYALITNKGTLVIQDNTDTQKDGTGDGLITTYITNPDQGDVPGYASNTITNNGNLTVKSGKIVNNGSGYACYAIDNQTNGDSFTPVVRIEGGRMQQMNAYTYAVRMFCNSTTKSNTVEVSGGVIEGGYGLWLQTPNQKENIASLTINGGVLNANDGAALYVGGTKAVNSSISINITDGTINGSGAIIQGPFSGTYGSISISGGDIENVQCGANVEHFISGGTFIEKPAEAYIALGYEAVQSESGCWNVQVKAQTGYAWDNGVLPSAPSVSGNVINVTNANAQYVLDGAYGSIDGKTINFTENITSTLELGRPTKYAGSNTKYYRSSYNTEERTLEFILENSGKVVDGNYTNLYKRSVKNVKFTANSGVSIKGIYFNAGSHIYRAGSYDCVREIHTTSDGSLYYCANDIEGITFEGITFTSPSNLETSVTEASMKNVTFKNCIFNIGSTDSGNYALRYYQESKTTSEVKNLVVDGCVFNTVYQGVYTMHINGVTVKDCTFSTTGHNAIAVQTQDVAFNHGNVVLTGNTGTGIGDRFIRFNNVASGTNITITGNNATCSKGTNDEECIKASSLASSGITYNVSGNTWNNYKEAYNEELRDK